MNGRPVSLHDCEGAVTGEAKDENPMSDNRSTTMTRRSPPSCRSQSTRRRDGVALPHRDGVAPSPLWPHWRSQWLGAGVFGFTLVGNDTGAVRSELLDFVPTTVAASDVATVTTVAAETPERNVATTVAATATTSPPPPRPLFPERLTGASQLRLDGVGPVRIGTTFRKHRWPPACPSGRARRALAGAQRRSPRGAAGVAAAGGRREPRQPRSPR